MSNAVLDQNFVRRLDVIARNILSSNICYTVYKRYKPRVIIRIADLGTPSMAILTHSDGKQKVYLQPMHLFGRGHHVDTRLPDPSCSRLQCIIEYHHDTWSIHDKSKNGTYLNGERLHECKKQLNNGDVVSFSADHSSNWKLTDDSAPRPVLIQEQGNSFIELSSLNILPSELQPEIFLSRHANAWTVEKGQLSQSVKGGDKLEFAGKLWTFFPNDLTNKTVTHTFSADTPTRLHFDISLNEENVRLKLTHDNNEIDMGYKSHHELLLFLARQRICDRRNDIPFHDQGWLATNILLSGLGIDENHLNILVYRARKAVEPLASELALVERRQGEIRLAACKLFLTKGKESVEYPITD